MKSARQQNFRFYLSETRRHKRSVSWFLSKTPEDGCLLVFNGYHRTWRAKASEGPFEFSLNKLSGESYAPTCDLYIVNHGVKNDYEDV